MANELTINLTMEYDDGISSEDAQVTDFLKSVSDLRFHKTIQTVGTSEEPLLLGDLSALGFCVLINKDPTNYVDIKVGTAGAIFARLFPNGGPAMLYLGGGAQVPYAIANTNPCKILVFIAGQ